MLTDYIKGKLTLIILALLLNGCGIIKPARVEVATERENAAAKSNEAPKDKALVFITRPSLFRASAGLFGVVIDGRLSVSLSVDSYTRLHLEPGEHNLTVFGYDNSSFQNSGSSFSEKLSFSAGESYFFECATTGILTYRTECKKKSISEGKGLIQNASLARFDPRNMTYEAWQADWLARSKARKAAANPAPQTQASTHTASVGSSDSSSLGDFLEVVAGVFFIALMIYGGAHSPTMVPTHPTPPQQSAYVQQTKLPESWTMNGQYLRGSNGETYKISGNSIYSNTGQTYQIIGNSMYGNDGSVCTRIGQIINCR